MIFVIGLQEDANDVIGPSMTRAHLHGFVAETGLDLEFNPKRVDGASERGRVGRRGNETGQGLVRDRLPGLASTPDGNDRYRRIILENEGVALGMLGGQQKLAVLIAVDAGRGREVVEGLIHGRVPVIRPDDFEAPAAT